jgi:hypothetical protein
VAILTASGSMLLTFMLSRNYFNFLVESKSPKTEALIAYEDKLAEEDRLRASRYRELSKVGEKVLYSIKEDEEDRFSASLHNSLDDIGDDEMSPGKPNNARGAVAVLRGGPKDENRYAKAASFILTPGGSRKRVKKQPSPTMGRPSPKGPAIIKEAEGTKCERHCRNRDHNHSLKKSRDAWNTKSSSSLKGSVLSQNAQDGVGPEGNPINILPAPLSLGNKGILTSEEKTTQRQSFRTAQPLESKYETPSGPDPEPRRGLNSRERLLLDIN